MKKSIIFFLIIFLCTSSFYQSQNLNDHFVYQKNMRINNQSGVPVAIYKFAEKKYNGTPEQIARQFLLENRELLVLKENLSEMELLKISKSPAGKHVKFIQKINGIPVIGSQTIVSINKKNMISFLINGFKNVSQLDLSPLLNGDEAIISAYNSLNIIETELPPKAELKIYEDSTGLFHLVWSIIIFSQQPIDEFLVLIDAHSGIVLKTKSLSSNYDTGTGLVFDSDPVTDLQNPSLVDSNDADYAALQPAYKANLLLGLNEADAENKFWLRGEYAWSYNRYLFPLSHFSVSETDPDDFQYKRNENGFEEVNIYYHIDKFRRYVGSLGFYPSWESIYSENDSAIAFDASTGANGGKYLDGSNFLQFGINPGVDGGEDMSLLFMNMVMLWKMHFQN